MTLPDPEVLDLLRDEFVVGWHNIVAEDHVGVSRGYHRQQTSIGTTNGAGGRNLQIFVLAPDLTVLHALPGFWHPDDLVRELRFAQTVDRLHRDAGRSDEAKTAMLRRLHEQHLRTQPLATRLRSTWQSFDGHTEHQRGAHERRDTLRYVGDRKFELRRLDEVVHRRMAAQPFVPFAEFDVEAFVDYGKVHYDNNRHVDRQGRRFLAAERRAVVREREATRLARQRSRQN